MWYIAHVTFFLDIPLKTSISTVCKHGRSGVGKYDRSDLMKLGRMG